MQPSVAVVVIGAIFAITLSTLICSVILRTAISLYNALADRAQSSALVPELEFGPAMLITLITSVINYAISFAIAVVAGSPVTNDVTGLSDDRMALAAQLASLPIALLVMAGVLTPALPTTFVRALLVSLCYLAIAIAIALAILAVVATAWLAFESLDQPS